MKNNNSTYRGEVKIDLLSPPGVGFHYELSFFKSGSTSINTEDQGKVIAFMSQLFIALNYHNFIAHGKTLTYMILSLRCL